MCFFWLTLRPGAKHGGLVISVPGAVLDEPVIAAPVARP